MPQNRKLTQEEQMEKDVQDSYDEFKEEYLDDWRRFKRGYFKLIKDLDTAQAILKDDKSSAYDRRDRLDKIVPSLNEYKKEERDMMFYNVFSRIHKYLDETHMDEVFAVVDKDTDKICSWIFATLNNGKMPFENMLSVRECKSRAWLAIPAKERQETTWEKLDAFIQSVKETQQALPARQKTLDGFFKPVKDKEAVHDGSDGATEAGDTSQATERGEAGEATGSQTADADETKTT